MAFLLNYFSGWLSGRIFFETLIVAFILGTIEFVFVQKLTSGIPAYYRLDADMAFPYISIGFAAAMIILKN